MNDEQLDMKEQKQMEAAIVRALETRQEVAVPVDFAARVRAALPPVAPVKQRVGVGRTVAGAAVAVMVVAVFLLAPHASASFGNVAFDLEMLLVAQMGAVAVWLWGGRQVV